MDAGAGLGYPLTCVLCKTNCLVNGGSRQESLEHQCKITNNKSRQEISNANMSILFLEGKRGYILHNIKFCFQWLQPRAKKAPSSSKINHMG